VNIFERINAAIEDAESSIITLATTLIPWLAPLLPAYLTYSHLTAEIQINPIISGAMAVTVELLGLSAVSTAFSAMRHNKVHRAEKRRVSLAFPVGAYLFYIAVVIIVNVVLALPLAETARPYIHATVLALLTLISAPAFVIAVARQEQREINKEWQERPSATDKPTDKRLPKNDNLAGMTVDDIMRQYGVSERTAYRRLAQARRNGREPAVTKQ
jgi:hypothetical protein